VADIAAQNQKYDQEIAAAKQATGDKEMIDFQKTQNDKTKIQIESAKTVYQNLKQQAGDLFDQMVFHTKSWGDFAKGIFKTAILTPIKDVFSSQVSAFFTQALTGQKVRFGELGSGEGAIGKLGSIYGRLGGGQPRFGEQTRPVSKLEAPNHLGDVSLVGNAVPVVIQNAAQVGQAHATAASSGIAGSALATSFGSLILSGGRGIQQITPEKIADGIAESTFIPESLPASYGVSPNGFPTMGEVSALGTPSGIFSGSDNLFAAPTAPPYVEQGLSGDSLGSGPSILTDMFSQSLAGTGLVAPTSSGQSFASRFLGMFGIGNPQDVHGTPPFVGNSPESQVGRSGLGPLGNIVSMFGQIHGGSGGGIFGGLSKLGGSLFGGIGKLFGRGGGTGEIDPETGAPLGHGIPGSPDNSSGEAAGGLLHGGMAGGLLAMAGVPLALDGIRRGGVLGTLEAAGGGAMVGFRYGGPIGAVIGAAVGGGIAAFKSIFGKTDRQHAKDLVKQVYGMDINNATADQIIAIAKQSYGNQIDVAVRSPQVRELLRLYSQATGQKSAEDKFVAETMHSASLVQAGGKLQQQAIYDNGNAYAYASPFGAYQGVQTSPIPTYGPTSGGHPTSIQLVVNGQSASDLLSGQVVKTATPAFVQSQSLSASKSSIGRTSQQNLTLSPSAISR
jgi:hypothetical protein